MSKFFYQVSTCSEFGTEDHLCCICRASWDWFREFNWKWSWFSPLFYRCWQNQKWCKSCDSFARNEYRGTSDGSGTPEIQAIWDCAAPNSSTFLSCWSWSFGASSWETWNWKVYWLLSSWYTAKELRKAAGDILYLNLRLVKFGLFGKDIFSPALGLPGGGYFIANFSLPTILLNKMKNLMGFLILTDGVM